MEVNYQALVVAESGTTVNLRQSPSTKSAVLKAVYVGTIVDVTEEYDDEWAKIKIDGLTGYMMRKFLRKITQKTVTVTLEYDTALALYTALQSAVKE